MRLLVVDWNILFAKRVTKTLRDLVPGLLADTATNGFELERRLECHTYDLILVDAELSLDPEYLRKVLDGTKTPKIFWRMQSREGGVDQPGGLYKPLLLDDLPTTLTKDVLPALHTHV